MRRSRPSWLEQGEGCGESVIREEGVGRAERTLAAVLRKTGGEHGVGREMGTGARLWSQVQQSRCEKWSNTTVSGRERQEIS